MKHRRKDKTIFRITLNALVAVLMMGMLLMAGSLLFSGVTNRLNQNAKDILEKQVENRKNYLQNYMTDYWSDLNRLAGTINTVAADMAAEGKIRISALDGSSEASTPLLLEIADTMISTLYTKQVSGIFVVLNTHDLDKEGKNAAKPALYIRDLDPLSTPSKKNADLLLERAPIQVMHSLDIPTDSSWTPLLGGSNCLDVEGFLYKPFQTANKDEEKQSAKEYGYWTTKPYKLEGDERMALSYSMPLILSDGTVYGVVGVELLVNYLESFLPNDEIQNSESGTYLLGTAVYDKGSGYVEMSPAAITAGPFFTRSAAAKTLRFQVTDGGCYLDANDYKYYADIQNLSLYSRNGPFSGEQWVLVGLVRSDLLFSFSKQVFMTLLLASAAALCLGILISIMVSRRLSRPITRLSGEVEASRKKGELPEFSKTGIWEIDRFSSAITELSQEVLDISTRFLKIMDMTSVEMGGYEIRDGSLQVFVTENFFHLLGMEQEDPEKMTADRLRSILDSLDERYDYRVSADGNKVYQIPLGNGRSRYLHMEMIQEGRRQVGLAEDVTGATMERLRIEHERDFDALTGLYSRRAFMRESQLLLKQPEKMKHAAMLMIDLDNLKSVNDNFGHDWGDQYIRQAGYCMEDNTPPGTLCARVSGDEFFAFLHGYDSQEEIRRTLLELTRAIKKSTIHLPSGRELKLSASGGVAWCPEDSTELNQLMKYADFAMYQVKKSHKGELGDFDLGAYNQDAYQNQSKREFHQLISHELLTYHFQPIISGETGRAIAYEALMRVDLPTLHTPDAVMHLAREEGCLHDIEVLTVFKSMEAFEELCQKKVVEEDAYLFVNSIASEHLTEGESARFIERFGKFQPRLVIEITESENLDLEALEMKRNLPGFSGMFALDDYGSGYNSEKNLLDMQPQFIKVDMAIIRDIDADADKQQILINIAAYAHQRGMKIIAEGVETASEAAKCLELGADLLQGYYLARPAAVPEKTYPEAMALIHRFCETKKK